MIAMMFSFSGLKEAAHCVLAYGASKARGKRAGHRILKRSDREELSAGERGKSVIDLRAARAQVAG
jgi:hypothetical protein